MRLTLVYAARFYQQGRTTFVQPAYGKYVEALAAQADELVLCGPVSEIPVRGSGYLLEPPNIEVVGLPYFERDIDGLKALPWCVPGLRRAFRGADLSTIMLPLGFLGPLAYVIAGSMRVPCFLHVVGDLGEQWSPEDYRSPLRGVGQAAVRLLEAVQDGMIRRSFTFVQGKALLEKHAKPGVRLVEAMETTIHDKDVVSAPRALRSTAPRRLLYAGNLIRPKGVHVLLDALAILARRGETHRLTVAGTGPEETSLRRQSEVLGLAERVEFAGFCSLDRVWALMDDADLFVFPSFGEGMPRVLLEAMARGLPIVSTGVGGIPGIIEHGRNGWLVQPGQSEPLAAAIRAALGDGDAWTKASEAGIATARRHTMDHYARLMVRELREAGLWRS